MHIEKIQIEIPLLLPEVADERDQCVTRLIHQLEGKEGLEKVHIAHTNGNAIPKLCFHYDPDKTSLEKVRTMAKLAGAGITGKYGHKLIEVEGIRHTRQARLIERQLEDLDSILNASVSASGMIALEYETAKMDEAAIQKALRRAGLRIRSTEVEVSRYLGETATETHDHAEHAPHEGHPEEKAGEPHDHGGGIFGKNSELIFSITCGVLLALGFVLSFVGAVPNWVSLVLYVGAYLFGGAYTAREAFGTLLKGRFDIDFLMFVAAVGAAILGEWAEGALLLFLFSLGHALEHYAMNKARKSIAALAELAPKTALLKTDGKVKEVAIEELRVGNIIVVRPNSKISADGVVVEGKSSVNQAPITGESVPVDKKPVDDRDRQWSEKDEIRDENRVFSGTINGNNTLEVQVLREAKDSTLSRLIRLVNEAQTQKSPTQHLSDRFEKYYVPAILGLVVLLNFAFLVIDEPFSVSFYRAMSVLIAGSPCALAISTPSAVLSGVARAARSGVLIKGGRPLEDLGDLTAVAFDKTGTLTEGKPRLTRVIPLGQMKEEDLLKLAVAVEGLSDHPLARAIVRDGKERLDGQVIPEADNLEAVLGRGIKARLDGSTVYMGNLDLYEALDSDKPTEDIKNQVQQLESEGNTTMLVRRDQEYIGILALMDTPREAAKATLQKLTKIGIRRMIMLTGDNQKVADAVAAEIGITESWGSLLPEEKVNAIQKLKENESKVAMVGDGVNDAPAMANSTVGIAMGAAGSDVALETADIALMADKLEILPFAIELSRMAKRVIRQNIFISLGMVAVLIPLTLSGLATLGPAVLMHEGSTVVVVFNALRLLGFKTKS